jgi:hypothetical protein
MLKMIRTLLVCCFLLPATSHALTCNDLDGAYVYSQEYSPIYLGFFGSEFSIDSINNSFGTYGSEYNWYSLRNSYGTYGSDYGIYSAKNKYSVSPPKIYKNGEFLAHLSNNTFGYENYSLDNIDENCTFYSSFPQPSNTAINPLTYNDVLLSVDVVGGGSVTSSNGKIDCPSDCNELYPERSLVILTAKADGGERFESWEGCYDFLAETCYVYMYTPNSIIATFTNNEASRKDNILWRNQSSGQVWLWRLNGLLISKSEGIGSVDLDWDIAGRGDFDGDGKSDILWRNNITGKNYIWLMDGFNYIEGKEVSAVSDLNWKIKAVADFNGDSKADIFWHHTVTGRTYVWLMNEFIKISTKELPTVSDTNWQIMTYGDFDNDGKADIYWRHQLSGTNYIWLMDGITPKSRYVLNTVGVDWDIVGAGDIDGNGTDDIIWRHSYDGRNWAHLMNNGQLNISQQINTVQGTEWQIKALADFDGDAKADIFWHNKSTGQTYIYLMNGVNIDARGFLNSVSTDWQVIH